MSVPAGAVSQMARWARTIKVEVRTKATLPRNARQSWTKTRPSSDSRATTVDHGPGGCPSAFDMARSIKVAAPGARGAPASGPGGRRLRHLEGEETQLALALDLQDDRLAHAHLGQRGAQDVDPGDGLLVHRVDDVA